MLEFDHAFVRFPGGVRWERGVGVQTQVVGEELRLADGATWGEYVTAILDLGAQPAFADSLVSFGGGEVTRAYRGTNTAPTTMPLEHITRPYYDAHQENAGWGATVPGDWSPDIPATRFLQVRMTLHAHLAAGDHAIAWDGRDSQGRRVPAGTYVLHLVTDQQTIQRSVLAVGE